MTCGQGESAEDAFCVGNCTAGTCPATDIVPPIEGNCVCNIFSCSCHGCGCTASTSRKLAEQSHMAYQDLCFSHRQQGIEYWSLENITAVKQLYDDLICPPDKEVSTSELEGIFKTMDQDQDGKISCFEYVTAKDTALVKECQGNSAVLSVQSTKIWSILFAFLSILCSFV